MISFVIPNNIVSEWQTFDGCFITRLENDLAYGMIATTPWDRCYFLNSDFNIIVTKVMIIGRYSEKIQYLLDKSDNIQKTWTNQNLARRKYFFERLFKELYCQDIVLTTNLSYLNHLCTRVYDILMINQKFDSNLI